MAFKRIQQPERYLSGAELTRALCGIGFRFFPAESILHPNIEDTLVAGAIEGMGSSELGDFRVMALMSAWFEIHSDWVNVDRLAKLVSSLDQSRVRAYFSAIGHFLRKDHRYLKLERCYEGVPILYGGEGSEFLIRRNGEDERFVGSALRVANKSMRRRMRDVETPESLARLHQDYHFRVLIGPSYRADMVSVLKREPHLSVSELARRTYGSFQTAWTVQRELEILGWIPTSVQDAVG